MGGGQWSWEWADGGKNGALTHPMSSPQPRPDLLTGLSAGLHQPYYWHSSRLTHRSDCGFPPGKGTNAAALLRGDLLPAELLQGMQHGPRRCPWRNSKGQRSASPHLFGKDAGLEDRRWGLAGLGADLQVQA